MVCCCRYGPFWICSTLIFVAASIGTFVTFLSHKLHGKDWMYDINLVTWSAGLFYGYVTIVPFGLYLILKYFSAPAGIVQLLCLYGYSLFIFIPALVSCSCILYLSLLFLQNSKDTNSLVPGLHARKFWFGLSLLD